MEAILYVSAPSNNLPNLQLFYDTIQTHIRALSALGKPPESNGPLLTTAILSKLPPDDGPTTVQSRLGYLLSGPFPVCQSIDATSFHVSALSCIMEEAEPHTFWQVESVGTTLPRQDAEHNFLQDYMTNKISVQPGGAYSLKFPWRLLPHHYHPIVVCLYPENTIYGLSVGKNT